MKSNRIINTLICALRSTVSMLPIFLIAGWASAVGPEPARFGVGSALSHNLATAFADTKAKLAAGNEAVDIMIIGDSLSVRTGTYTPFFRSKLQQLYGDAGYGYQGFSVWTGARFNTGWTNGIINGDTPPHHSLDGLWSESTGQGALGGSARFTAHDDRVLLHYVAEPNGRVMQIEQPGGTVIDTIDFASPTPVLRTWSWTFAGGSREMWFRPVTSGTALILGQDNSTGATSGVRVHRAANGGWGVEQFLQRNWTFDAQMTQIDPDLVYIWLGQNDQAYTLAGYKIDMGLLVDRVQADVPDAEIVLIGTYDSDSPNLIQLIAAMEQLALTRGLGFINMFAAAGSYQFFVDNGYLDDGLHFSLAGGQYIAGVLFDAFESDGWSLHVPCPGDADGDGVLGIGDLQILLKQFGGQSSFSTVDMDRDQDVDLQDLVLFLHVFGTSCVSASPPIVGLNIGGTGGPVSSLGPSSSDAPRPAND